MPNSSPQIAVIISTYNSPEWLGKVLIGYDCQSYKNFEVIIADDGSKKETTELIKSFEPKVSYPIIHVWHEDLGFRKTEILNKAITASNASYLLFTDGDCIPRHDLLQIHMHYREAECFLSGGYYKLPMRISALITFQDIKNQLCFSLKWLKQKGLKSSIKNLKLTKNKNLASVLNNVTPTKATWNGHNASGWKTDIVKANGFDTRMQYGGEDRELGERLFNAGLKSKQIRYSAICVHLDHKRGYVKPEMIEKNKKIRLETKVNKHTITKFGIKELN